MDKSFPRWIDYSALHRRARDISNAHKSNNLVFFLGAGASIAYSRNLPSWKELITQVAHEVSIGDQTQMEEINILLGKQRYPMAAQAIKQYGNFTTRDTDSGVDKEIKKIIETRLKAPPFSETLHLSILDFGTPIVTTNYDTIIENIIDKHRIPGFEKVSISYSDQDSVSELLDPSSERKNYVLKLHGSLSSSAKLIVDESDYSDLYFLERFPVTLQLLRHIFSSKMVVFVGYSLSDPDLMYLTREATKYSKSYQHMVLLHRNSSTDTELETLRSTYKIDPITFDDFHLLPFFLSEMRNFITRESIPLILSNETSSLNNLAKKIVSEIQPRSSHSLVLFGSYVRGGDYIHSSNDVDLLFLSDSDIPPKHKMKFEDSKISDKSIDITFLQFREFEELLRHGDAFANSVLVTGFPLLDREGKYGILQRGFKPDFQRNFVMENAIKRLCSQTLRHAYFKGLGEQKEIRVLYQWLLALMQLTLIVKFYPTDSTLSLSLLGNPRFVIRKFVTHFSKFPEETYLEIMRAAKIGGSIDKLAISNPISFLMLLKRSNIGLSDQVFPSSDLVNRSPIELMALYENLRSEIIDFIADIDGETGRHNYGTPDGERTLIKTALKGSVSNSFLDLTFFIFLHKSLGNRWDKEESQSTLKLTLAHWARQIDG